MKEEYRDVKGYEDIYQVSSLGNIKSLKRRGRTSDKILKQTLAANGVMVVCLVDYNRKTKTQPVNRIVFKAFNEDFVDNRKTVLVNLDGDASNNRIDNLNSISKRESLSFSKNSSSKFVGVSYHKLNKRWLASIYLNDKVNYLGYFTDELEAHEAYINALNNKDK